VRAVFAALLCTLLFSVSVACGHRSAKLIGGTEANFWRLAFAAVFLGAWAFTFGQGLGGSSLPVFLVSGIVGVGIGDTGLFQALPRLGSRLSLLIIQCLTAPFGALIERVWLGTTLSVSQILCGLIILGGVGIALSPGKHLGLTRRDLVPGILFCILAALGGAGGAVLSRKAYVVTNVVGPAVDGGTAAFQRILGGLFVAGLFLLAVKRRAFEIQSRAPHGLVVEAAKRKWRGVWPWILINSLAGQTLGVSCMQWALETTPTGIVLAVIAITPIVIIPVAFVMEGERPTVHSLVGGAIAVAGVIALTLSR
jgi:drug/metabolite transporter (DMT)-like permease